MKRLIKTVTWILLAMLMLTSVTGCALVRQYIMENEKVVVVDPTEAANTNYSESTVSDVIDPNPTDVIDPNPTEPPAPVPADTPTPVPTEPPTPTPTPVPPTPTPLPDSFLFGGVVVQRGQTYVEVTGKKDAIIRITPEEMDLLIKLCPDLTTLTLDYCCMADYSRIGELTKLKNLMIGTTTHEKDPGIPLVDIDWISSLRDLRTLYLQYNKISDIRALSGLTKLEELNLGWNELSDDDLDDLTDLPLRVLYLYNNSSLRNVSALSDISSLELLYLNGNKKLKFSGIKKLTKLSHLKELNVSYCPIEDFEWVQDFKRLETLRIEKVDYIDYGAYFDLMYCSTLQTIVISKEDTQAEIALEDMVSFYRPDIEIVYGENYKK